MAARLKTFSFVTLWRFEADADEVWEILVDPGSWPEWWNGLESSDVDHRNVAAVGSTSDLVWRAPLGYRLRLQLTLTEVEAERGHLAFTSDGDLVGQGSCDVLSTEYGSSVQIRWRVAPTKTWMRSLSYVLTPVYRVNHATLMRAGQKGLYKRLHSSKMDIN